MNAMLPDPAAKLNGPPSAAQQYRRDELYTFLWEVAERIGRHSGILQDFVELRDRPGSLYAGKHLLADAEVLRKALEYLAALSETRDG